MPLDAAISIDQRGINLAQAALNAGIIPLSMAVLDAHKAAEVAKHPGSLVARYPSLIRTIIFIGVLGCLIAGMILSMIPTRTMDFAHFAIGQGFISVAVIGLMVVMHLPFTRSAVWQSEFCKELGDDAPSSFREMANAVRQQVPNCHFEVGRLVQNKVVLDPYLIIHHRLSFDPIVIGIWDGDRIIASATQI